MKLAEFTSADPRMTAGGWRQELVAGEVRTLAPRDPDSAFRAMQVTAALLGRLRRGKADAKIDTGSGISIAAGPGDEYGGDEYRGDEFRVADVVIALSESRGRHLPTIVCQVVADPEHPAEDERERVALFQRHPSVRQVLLFAVARPFCRVHRRIAGAWEEETYSDAEDAIRLSQLNLSLFLAQAYSDLLPAEPI